MSYFLEQHNKQYNRYVVALINFVFPSSGIGLTKITCTILRRFGHMAPAIQVCMCQF